MKTVSRQPVLAHQRWADADMDMNEQGQGQMGLGKGHLGADCGTCLHCSCAQSVGEEQAKRPWQGTGGSTQLPRVPVGTRALQALSQH